MGSVTITNIEKTETYQLNGIVSTVGDAVRRFTGGDDFDGVVKLGGRPVEDFDMPLREGDVLVLLNETVAGGGIKGAR